jgi:MFS family permease
MSPPGSASRARYAVVGFGVVLAMIQYVDRICISKAAPLIQKDLSINDVGMGWIYAAFTAAYALFEVPTGWMGDRFGARKTLVRVTLWWSFFTAATGWVTGLKSMIGIRFLFGAGEAGCFPNLTRAFTSWLRPEEKVRAQSILWLCARWSGAFTPLLVTWILTMVSWRTTFQLFGLLGVVWAVFFWRWFSDDPAKHPSVNEGERALLAGNASLQAGHSGVPWGRFTAAPTTWLLWLQYFCLSYVWYFYVTWLPTMIKNTWGHLGIFQQAMLAGVPLFCGGFGSLLSGAVLPRLTAAFGSLKARRLVTVLGFLGTFGSLVLASRNLDHPVLAIAALGAASFFGDLTMPCSWGACMDVGGRFAGTYSGAMNMMGNLGGVAAPIVAGYLSKDWSKVILISAGFALVGAVCWMLIDPVRRLDQDPEPAPA